MRRILVIGTGGTISCAESADGLRPAFSVSELLRDIELPAEVRTEQLFELDSTNMTYRHWITLARCIRERYDEFDGFVITHGTDTMAYAAAALSCLIRNSRKPIVFTGSMLPMSEENSDAPRNLREALVYAASERAYGVRVVFGGAVFDGRSVTKLRSDKLNAFACLNGGEMPYDRFEERGCEDESGCRFEGETRFYDKLSDEVYLAKLIPGQEPLIPESARAVILEGYGTGGVPDYLIKTVERLSARGVYIIIATQCASGGTDLRLYEVGRTAAERFSLLETGKMSIEYAVARARWALACSDGFEGFKKLFSE